MKADLIVDALDMAVRRRRPQRRAVIHYSDQGSQYMSHDFAKRCRAVGVVRSTGSVGNCYDNEMCESFFATLKCELLARRRFAAASEARPAVFESVEGCYNPRRRHSAIAYMPSAAYEQAAGGWRSPLPQRSTVHESRATPLRPLQACWQDTLVRSGTQSCVER